MISHAEFHTFGKELTMYVLLIGQKEPSLLTLAEIPGSSDAL